MAYGDFRRMIRGDCDDVVILTPLPQGGDLMKDVKAVAKELGISTRTVWRMIKRGDIKPVRVGPKLIRISEEEIERLKRGE